LKFLTKNEQDTIALGRKYGQKCSGGEIFLLTGELGGGKTQFAKGLAQGLGIKEYITSPTFNYENIYHGKNLDFYHFDLYRENTLDEDIRLILDDATKDSNGVVAVEWSERLGNKRPKTYFEVQFIWVSENERKITINTKGQTQNDK
jgi:tRNA threonylcarbamoyladenosine biosynthesis protein TsaE